MIMRESLFLCRADLLGDPFEGALPRRILKEVVFVDSDGAPIPREVVGGLIQAIREFRERMLISCWYMAEAESDGMWRVYGGGSGVAVKSSIGRIKDSLQTEYRFMIGAVNYADYKTATIPMGNLFWPFVHKRQEFAHEREVRVALANYFVPDEGHDADAPAMGYEIPGVQSGLEIATDLTAMIDEVVVAPDSPGWYIDVVKGLLSRCGVEKVVRSSELAAIPVWELDVEEQGQS
jgi:hypothetical protein